MADVSGWIGMGCEEILLHTDDIARGLGLSYRPPHDLAARILARLFPWAPADVDPLDSLRWAAVRAALPDRERLGPDWYWHCLPLMEWDGTITKAQRAARMAVATHTGQLSCVTRRGTMRSLRSSDRRVAEPVRAKER